MQRLGQTEGEPGLFDEPSEQGLIVCCGKEVAVEVGAKFFCRVRAAVGQFAFDM